MSVSAHRLSELIARIEAHYADKKFLEGELDPVVALEFADYGAATTFAPPIRTLVYFLLDVKLTEEFARKMQGIVAKEAEPSGRTKM